MDKCINCGKVGHIYKNCNYPITSYGFICINLCNDNKKIPLELQSQKHYCENKEIIHFDNLNVKYLMVQRKNSFSYVEFVRGKYDLKNKNYISKLFSNMTEDERNKFINYEFNFIWNEMWNKNDLYSKEYKESLKKFNTIKNGYVLINKDESIQINLNYFLKNTKSEIDEPEFGFPKGRRNYNESDLDCAKREFSEETGYKYSDMILLSKKPFEEIFTGMNGKRYKYVYYFAIINEKNIKLNKLKNYNEIRKVCWFNYGDVQQRIKLINVERKELLKRIHTKIIKNSMKYKIFLYT